MNAQPGRARAVLVGLALALTVFQTGCATLRPAPAKETLMQKQWGIEVNSLRLSANGHMLDFRYRVLDPAKAYARAEAQILATTEYTGFLWAMMFGWYFYAEPVTLPTIAGALLIVAACLIVARTTPQLDPIEPAAA